MAQIDKNDILADVVAALRDENQTVLVETLAAKKVGLNAWAFDDAQPQMPQPQRHEKKPRDFISDNHKYASSIKVGKDILMRRIPGTLSYTVRTPRGEAKFDSSSYDFMNIWGYALQVYDGRGAQGYAGFVRGFKNEKLASIAAAPMIEKDKRSKFDVAKENLAKMGIEKTDEELKKRLAQVQAKASEI